MTQSETLPTSKTTDPKTTERPFVARVWDQSSGKVGTILTALILLVAILGAAFAELFTGYSPTEFMGEPFENIGVFGTDDLGRSVASRFLAGGLTLLWYSFAATAIGVILGAIMGMIAAYTGGFVDSLIMRTNDVVLAFPQLVLALLAIVIFGPTGWVLILVIGLSHAPRVARVARAATLSVTSQDYIMAAQMYAMPRWQILSREIFPNITGPIAVEAGLRLTYSIGTIASLSFLGLGMQPPTADWGLMINENRIALSIQPWGVLLPVIAIAILTVGTNLLADAIARATATSATQTS